MQDQFGNKLDQSRSVLNVGRHPRKDGKFQCDYFFPLSGKRIRRLLTAEQIKAEEAAGRYEIRHLSF